MVPATMAQVLLPESYSGKKSSFGGTGVGLEVGNIVWLGKLEVKSIVIDITSIDDGIIDIIGVIVTCSACPSEK